jgi:aldehyde dehydrogenase (NAD+)
VSAGARGFQATHANAFYINGEWVPPNTFRRIEVINSGTEELYATVPEAVEADVDRAVAAARKAFDVGPWPRMTPVERGRILRAIGKEYVSRIDTLAEIWTVESGVIQSIAKPVGARFGSSLEYYADLAESFPFVEKHKPGVANAAYLVREPVGVVGAIIPWNAPVSTIAHKSAAALLAGCTVVVKPSPQAPLAAWMFAEACEAAGVPPGVVNFVVAEREVSERLVRHPDVDKISFTGSTAAGRRIGSICAERVARCTLELGGKSAAIILDDYDIEKAASSISASSIFITGQVCSSLTRVIVTQDRHDALVEALVARLRPTRIGDPFDAATQMGPLSHRAHRERVEGYIAKGKAEGATLALGGGRPAHLDRGFFIEPTVFANVDNSMTIAREEIFGPVLSVIPARNESDAVRIANDTIYGLNGSVFTQDPEKAYHVARQVRSGTFSQNGFKIDPNIGGGGFKQSGIGREGGAEGLYEYLEAKTLLLDEPPRELK